MCLQSDRILRNLVKIYQEVDVHWIHTAAFVAVLKE